jgi:hypothetical protein
MFRLQDYVGLLTRDWPKQLLQRRLSTLKLHEDTS